MRVTIQITRNGPEPAGDAEVCNALMLLSAILRDNKDGRRGGHDPFEFHNAATGHSEIIDMTWGME